jgi:GR25 family glycosyltransferase involved in LPS biosynthesis
MNFDIYHIINENQEINKDITLNIFLLIKSIRNIYINSKIYYYYYNLPDNNSNNKLWNNILEKYKQTYIEFIKIDIPERIFPKYKNTYINKILYNNGGIYLNNYVLLLNKIDKYHEYYKSKNNEIIYSKINSKIAYSLYLNEENQTNEMNEIDKIKIIEYNYNNNDDNINNIYDNEIYDYSFGTYFHLINNCSFFIGNRDIFNFSTKITIYNLLIRYILGYEYFYNIFDIKLLDLQNKYELINGIDKIYWINLDKSIDRKINMENLLSNFSIPNERISAINSNLDNNIKLNYFKLDKTDKYPKYSNTEYAILASHLYTINKCMNDKNNICLVCEDDLSFDFIKYWKYPISDIIKNAPNDWDIIMLGYFSLKLNYEEYSKWNNEWSALSYLVNKNNIKDKFNELKVYEDNEYKNFKWKCKESDLMVSDNYIFSKFNTYVYKYPYFTFPNNNDSTFHSDHLNYHKIYKNCNYLTLNDIVDNFL